MRAPSPWREANVSLTFSVETASIAEHFSNACGATRWAPPSRGEPPSASKADFLSVECVSTAPYH